MMSQGKNWVRNNYGTMCLFVDKIENKGSVMLHKQKIPEKLTKLKSV